MCIARKPEDNLRVATSCSSSLDISVRSLFRLRRCRSRASLIARSKNRHMKALDPSGGHPDGPYLPSDEFDDDSAKIYPPDGSYLCRFPWALKLVLRSNSCTRCSDLRRIRQPLHLFLVPRREQNCLIVERLLVTTVRFETRLRHSSPNFGATGCEINSVQFNFVRVSRSTQFASLLC